MGWEIIPPEVPIWRQEFNACANCERLEVRVRELEAKLAALLESAEYRVKHGKCWYGKDACQDTGCSHCNLVAAIAVAKGE